ncbi:MAG: nucleotidyltransferase domain-containing protein [Leptospiraceae bacterium]|nr:nucleotidyltransferase domain-containing protein [Leptospiraceae bacterium]MCP5496790.1 nucleotidyltransferase domain-containing protein [Leptospiraceae bacterium]
MIAENKTTRYEFSYLKDETIKRIIPTFKPEKIFIFGSYAKGTENENSDLDILIEFKEVEHRRKLAIQIRKLLENFPIATDILVISQDEESKYKQKKWSIYYHALKEGKLIYEREYTGMENMA